MDEQSAKTYAVKIKKLPHSRIEISATISTGEFDVTRSAAVKRIGADLEIPGFRKGHAPENIIAAKLGEGAILEEMAELAIARAYAAIIREEKLDVLGRPEVRITKIAMGNPLEFTLTTATFPEITLPDYKKLAGKEAQEETAIIVTDEEVEKAIEQIRTMRAGVDERREGATGLPVASKIEPPPLDDIFVKTLGDFADVADFKTKLRENMRKEKERAAKDKKRMATIDAILAKATIDIPEIIVEQELLRMKEEFAHDVKRMGLSMDGYLGATKKTQEELEKDWKPTAEKRAKTQLVVSKIAELEKITPDSEQLKKEVVAIRLQHPDAKEENVESYIRMILTNEKVFELLESQGA
ncbi:MAG: trigger factor [bacterium]|nr:trigger factor [bacterium]